MTARSANRKYNWAPGAIASASLIWLASIVLAGWWQELLPWCSIFAIIALSSLEAARRANHEYKRAKSLPPHSISLLRIAQEERKGSFGQSCAFTYVCTSLLFAGWIAAHLLEKPHPIKVQQQVVDIQLSSPSDFQNKHMLLAASKEKPTLRKSPVSDLISQRGQLKPKLIAASKTSETKKTKPALKKSAGEKAVIKLALARQAEPVKALKKETLSQAPAPRTIAQTAKPVIIQPWKSNMAGITAASARPKKEESSAKNKMVLQEVEPAEMVEITENDGDHSNNIWQPGGRTYDGNGARSTLTFYLKELNRRLRRAWIPNKDQDQKTALYFRISRSGRLMMVKLVRSSGQAANDEAAMKAITACAPFAPLPSDYPYSFLDLNYTFSYKFDQLSAAEDATQL